MRNIDRECLARVARDHHLLALYLFGSVASGTAGPDSDVDVAALFFPDDERWREASTYIDLYDDLAGCVRGTRLDLLVMQRAPLELQYRVLAQGEVLYCAAAGARADYEDRVLRDYLDFAVELRLFEAEVAEAIREMRPRGRS